MTFLSSWAHEIRILCEMIDERRYTNVRIVAKGDDPILLLSARRPDGENVLVFLAREECKFGVKPLRKVRKDAADGEAGHIILLTADGLTPFAQKELADSLGTATVECFKKQDLAVNPRRHIIVPSHELLSAAEGRELTRSLHCKSSAVPKLKATDAMARFLHLPVGRMVRISDRQMGCLEADTSFRLVV